MYTVVQILTAAGVASEASTRGGVVVQLTTGNQLVGTYADLLKYRAAVNAYNGWEVHHIFEALDIDRLGLSAFSPVYEQQICVLIPAPAHHRVNSILRRANPTRLSATGSELEPAYRDAYNNVGDYCGSSETVVSQELFNVFKAVLKNLVESAATARNIQITKARLELQKLEHQIALEKGLHEELLRGSSPSPLQTAAFIASLANPLTAAGALVNPANRSVIGGAVNVFNPVKRPELSIWAKAEANARVANQALLRRDPAGAATAISLCQTHFLKADEQFKSWRDHIDLAGRRAELAIGVAAIVASIAVTGVFAAQAAGAAATGAAVTGVAGQGAVAGTTSTGVRVAAEIERGVRVVLTASSLAEEQAGEAILTQEVPKLFMQART